jgi:hypothetical protein
LSLELQELYKIYKILLYYNDKYYSRGCELLNSKISFLAILLIFVFGNSISAGIIIDLYKQQRVDSLFDITSIGGSGSNEEIMNWVRLDDLRNNPQLFSAISDDSSGYRIAVFDTGLDHKTWSEIEDRYPGVNVRFFKHETNQNTEWTFFESFHGHDYTQFSLSGHYIKHGSAICSLIGSLLEGTNSELLVFQVASAGGVIDSNKVYDALLELDWLWGQGIKVKVVSMSIGGNIFNSNINQKINELSLAPYYMTFISASGNEYQDDINSEQQIYPAAYYNSYSVGGIIAQGDWSSYRMTLARGSTCASCFWRSDDSNPSPRESSPTVVAPGDSIEVFFDLDDDNDLDYFVGTGTSLATPIVAVVVFFIYKIQYYRYSSNTVLPSEIYYLFSQYSEGYYLMGDQTKEPGIGNDKYWYHQVGWGCVDFFDYCNWAYDYYAPPSGGGGGGGHLFR